MNILKSIGAALAGILFNVIASTGTDFLLIATGIATPFGDGMWSPPLLAAALFYRTLYAVAGSYITAALAPANPMKHVIVLGIIGTVMSIVGVVAHTDTPSLWYPIGLVITSLPASWVGGKLRVSRIKA